MHTLLCPNCLTNTVQVPAWDFSATEATVPFCGDCNGGLVKAAIFPISALQHLAVPETVLRHRDGLVAFA